MSPLEEQWRQALEQSGRRRRLQAREPLFLRGDRADHLYRLERGCVRLERVTTDGTPMTSLLATDGDYLAEASLWAERYHCDALAEEPSRVEAVPGDLWRARLAAEPELALLWIAALSRRVQQLRTLLELRSIRSASARVLAWVEQFPERARAGRGAQRVIASELGVRPETLSRTLATLVDEGRLLRRGQGLELPSLEPSLEPSTGSR